ncbi:MAG: Fic family protein [Actinomycetota bacterium]|nr:Fic family protein [Actinomycetota bacterium]
MVTERVAWPAVDFEAYDWHSRDDLPASRQARLLARQPYQAAIPPVIADVQATIPAAVLAVAEAASTEIARFDAEAGAEIAPFSAILLRSESAASSKIENLTASARAIAEAELGHGNRNAALIVANERAMTAAIALADRLDGPAILNMHDALLRDSAPAIAGRWRDQQVWIGGSDYSPHAAQFIPPHQDRVPAAIDDLIRFIARTDIPTLAHAAITHAQFETIHPFPDGNGRVGRALVHAQLRHARLTRHVTVPVSAGLLTDIDAYFAALGAYRDGDPAPIVERFADATFAALANGRQLVADLHRVRAEWSQRVKARRDSAAWKVTEIVERHPVVNAPSLSRELGIPQTNVYRALQPLVDAGVLVEFTNNKRDRLWRAPDVLEALDAFAARTGRRQLPGR